MRPGDGIWQRNAYYGEMETFDSCFGHQPGNGEYHHHVQPVCLRAQLNDNVEVVRTGRTGSVYREHADNWRHSPILGWSFDGYPIYGPYGYSDARDAGSTIVRVRPSFRLRQMTVRDSLPDWALSFHAGVPQHLDESRQGPPVNARFPLGRYVEDYEYVAGLGDLDQYNGRFTVTPEFPKGTYAYFVTIDAAGKPAFPFIFGLEYYGSVSGGRARSVPEDAREYFAAASNGAAESGNDVRLSSWLTTNSNTPARAVSGWDPSAGPQTTWPGWKPEGARAFGGVSTPANADVQRIRSTDSDVYINSNDLPSYVIGPWFDSQNGGVFLNLASAQRIQVHISREPQAANETHTRTPMGPVGIWVNGVAAFNALDGASYNHNIGNDTGGGLVATGIVQVSSASLEHGPVTPGSLVTAYADFDAVLATSTEKAAGAPWPAKLGGATVTIRDSTGATHAAAILYASPARVDYRVPEEVLTGIAHVTISVGGASVPGELNIVPIYPGLFQQDAAGMSTAPRLQSDASGRRTVVLYGTGFHGAKDISVSFGGQPLQSVSVEGEKMYPGVEQIKAALPAGVKSKGKVEVVVRADGKPSNPVYLVVD